MLPVTSLPPARSYCLPVTSEDCWDMYRPGIGGIKHLIDGVWQDTYPNDNRDLLEPNHSRE